MDTMTTDEVTTHLIKALAAVERQQERDEANNPDSGIFWEGYQAALHDLLVQVAPEMGSQELGQRALDMVAVDVAGWENLEKVDAYAVAGRVSREQAIRWLVNMATAHPTRESCYEGECDGWPEVPIR
jgi:hypothetical protein